MIDMPVATTKPDVPTLAVDMARRDKTREQILEAAHATLIRIGFERITTRRIADEAQVNIATLHYHFGSKETLLTETIRYSLHRAEKYLRDAVRGSQNTSEAINRTFGAIWQLVQEKPGVLRFDLAVRGFRDNGARAQANAVSAAYRQLIEELIARHLSEGGTLSDKVTPAILSGYMLAAIDGVILQHTVNGDDTEARQSLELIRRHIFGLLNLQSDGALEYRAGKDE